jgi:protease-4
MSELDPVTPAPEEPPRTTANADVPPRSTAVPPPLPSYAAAPAPPPPRKSRTGAFLFGAFSGCALILVALFFVAVMIAALHDGDGELSLSGDKIAVVPIEGEILDGRETMDLLQKYADNESVKAIIIRINSPGGAIAPSQEIYSAIRRIRTDTGKPIVASLDSVAASGGFYIASACDRIVSNPGSITGSIGVIMQWFDMKDLIHWAKLNPQTITSGALKDAGSPYREMTPAERQYFQSIVSQLHQQFVRDVAHGRSGKMSHEEVAAIADGRVFTGEEALKLKLVDELGSIDDAVRTAAKLAHISGTPVRIWPKHREGSLFELMTSSGEGKAILERIISRRIPKFSYQW